LIGSTGQVALKGASLCQQRAKNAHLLRVNFAGFARCCRALHPYDCHLAKWNELQQVPMRHRILLTRRWPAPVEQYLSDRFDTTLNTDDVALSSAALVAAMRSYDALCPTVTDALTAEVLMTPGATVRLLSNIGVGTNHIDLDAARRAGVAVSNTPDVLTDATAELALLLMLMTTRRAGEGERELRSGGWHGWRPTHMLGQSLTGKTLGMVGFGRIGRATARLAQAALGMRVAYFSRHPPVADDNTLHARYLPLDELLASADVVSLHCPATPATHHLIDARALQLMKPSAVLINTARGSVVDEAALASALATGRIAAAGLDVYEHEPRIHPALLTADNAVLLPHLGSATQETRVAMGLRAAANLERFFAGEPLLDPVIPPRPVMPSR
jgi:lactate dehydrogenase-like 2-hydroxyacid dehydrogenase